MENFEQVCTMECFGSGTPKGSLWIEKKQETVSLLYIAKMNGTCVKQLSPKFH